MIGIADPEESTKAHDGVFDLSVLLIDHYVVNASKLFSRAIVDVGAIDLTGGDQPTANVGRIIQICRFASGFDDQGFQPHQATAYRNLNRTSPVPAAQLTTPAVSTRSIVSFARLSEPIRVF
jgi:hypothetical protein